MPTVVKVLPKSEFIAWVEKAKNSYANNDEIINDPEELKLTKNIELLKGVDTL
jgi:heme/copper-type cytochrome/quinol oxidase subunit 2